MSGLLTHLLDLGLKFGGLLLVANEIRGLILTAPVFYAMYQAGGTLAAIWLGICGLGGVALSVIVPLFAARRLKAFVVRKAAGHAA